MEKTELSTFNSIGRNGRNVLLLSVFVVATCGIVYELLISTVSSYFMGSSVMQFSITIGLFLFFMGCGSWLSRYIENPSLLETFIAIEICIGLFGGLSAVILHAIFTFTDSYAILSSVLIALIAGLIGLEIPLVMRVVQHTTSIEKAISQVFSFDYVGALIASLAFPLILLPHLGLLRTGICTGLANLLIAILTSFAFRKYIVRHRFFTVAICVISTFFCGVFIYASKITTIFEETLYEDQIVLTKQTPYQRLVLTKWRDDLRLHIDGNLQFASRDEYRYHEPLVHVPMLLARDISTILILGGGDGLVLREVFRYQNVKEVHLVDIDPAMTDLGKNNKYFKKVNENSFNDKRLTVINEDAFTYVQNTNSTYSVVIIDLPDPNDYGLGKMYTREFYEMLKKRCTDDAIIITQATSPYFSRESFWCIERTMQTVFEDATPMHVNVPSFGEWGYVLSGPHFKRPVSAENESKLTDLSEKIITRLQMQPFASKLRFFDTKQVSQLFVFSPDMKIIPVKVHTLESQALIAYYSKNCKEWR